MVQTAESLDKTAFYTSNIFIAVREISALISASPETRSGEGFRRLFNMSNTRIRQAEVNDLQRLVDVNLRPPWWQRESIMSQLQGARWIKLNEEELAQIVPEEPDIDRRVEHLLSQLAIEQLVVTCGEAGALCISSEGERLTVAPEDVNTVVDVVGAGDAFSSVFLLGQIQNWPLSLTLKRAQDFAGAIVGLRGATIKDMNFYQPFITAWGLAA